MEPYNLSDDFPDQQTFADQIIANEPTTPNQSLQRSERIVLQCVDGSIAIINPVEPLILPESIEAYLDRIEAHAVSANPALSGSVRVSVIDASRFPSRRFRNCWRVVGGAVAPDDRLVKKQIMSEVRAARDKLLKASDNEKMKLDDIGTEEEKKEMAEYRKTLRDFPATIEQQVNLMTVEQLETFQPKLPEKPEF